MIGDVLTTSILFEAIKKQYPNSELHYVINSHTYAVVENNPFIDRVHLFTPEHQAKKRKLWQFANQLRREHYDAVIDVYSKISSNIISIRSRAKIRISIEKGHNSFIYNYRFKHKLKAETSAGLAIENRLQLLEPLDIDISKIIRPKIYLTEAEKENAKRFLESHTINLDKPVFMIGVLGSGDFKTYPFPYMAKVIDSIVSVYPDAKILFNYIPKQEADAKTIFNLCESKTQNQIVFNVFGKSLREFLAITSHCDGLIGNEGGAINMAKALYIPTFTIFSPWIKKEAWNIFDDGKKHVSVHLRDYNPDIYSNIVHPKVLKKKASELYKQFKPVLFQNDLKTFLQQFN